MVSEEFELIDKENDIVIKTYKIGNEIVARCIYDFKNYSTKTEGSLIDFFKANNIKLGAEESERYFQIKKEEAKIFLDASKR